MDIAAPGVFFAWGLRFSVVAFALQTCCVLLAVGLLLASFIPLFQPWAAARQADASSLLLLQALVVVFYLPLQLSKELRRPSPQPSWRGRLKRFPRVSLVLCALGFGIWLFNFWFIPQWPQNLLHSAMTPADQAAFRSATDLHWVRVAAINALASCLFWMGFGYQWRWLAHQRLAQTALVG